VTSSIIPYLKIVWGLPPRLGPSPPPSKSGAAKRTVECNAQAEMLF